MEHLWDYLEEQLHMEKMDPRSYSPLALAFIGDAVYDLVIRSLVLSRGNKQPQKLHQDVRSHVKASAQAALIRKIEPALTEEELAVFKRGRNAKSGTVPKNTDVATYRAATGFEALAGYLYLKKDYRRLVDLIAKGLDDD